jgi:molecular chaperone DnaK (HSP70)
VFQAIEQAKIGLTRAQEVFIRVPELELNVALTHRMLYQFMEMEGMFSEMCGAIEKLFGSSSLSADSIDAVISTGGSSRLPPVLEFLGSMFPGRLIEFDPFTGIASGLAIASHHGYMAPQANVRKP